MIKCNLDTKGSLKKCYGTFEWSEHSGICRKCKLKDDCGKINNSKNKN